MSKKLDLLEAASRVILESGVSGLTLEAVAVEANVSKGGLLYHYPSKDKLIQAMNQYVIDQFRAMLEHEVKAGRTFHQAYLYATLNSLRDAKYLNVNTSLLAAVSNNRDILAMWKEEYKDYRRRFSAERCKPEVSLLIQTVCDGLWYSKLFDLSALDLEKEQQLLEYLLVLLEEN
ncbi:TetR/AcrR family transcriptional regulator [Paenibacillus sp. GCM10027626]|uniref:TetR/AcrR family transcriptional regulator n=1 Tax=Paenibacillus sp. GCM10027626 TaxID=3273411 RepID=UPI0036334428